MMRIRALGAIGIIAGLTIVSGTMHGRLSDRWGLPAVIMVVARKLEEIPHEFGNWRLESSHEIDEVALRILKCAGYVHRQYVNQETGQSVRVSVICGPPGPTSVHTPDICYDSQGHTLTEGPEKVTIQDVDGSNQEFWTLMLEANNVDRSSIRVYYAWSAGGVWMAPKNPRISLSNHEYLFKLQLAAPLVGGWDLGTSEPCLAFLRDFVPAAKRYMTLQD